MLKRSLALFLSLAMVISMVPLQTFAQTVQGTCENHPVHQNCGYIAPVEGVDCNHKCTENCTLVSVEACLHDHGVLGCTWVEEVAAVTCGHDCGDGSCGYRAPQTGVDCTCEPTQVHADTCASLAGGACDCQVQTVHQDTCTPVAPDAGQSCDFAHTGCGCAEAIPAHWNCGHVCTEATGCVTWQCAHSCADGSCSYVEENRGAPCSHKCALCDPEIPAVNTVTDWMWVDPEEYLTLGELAIPGTNPEKVASCEMILSMLPAAIATKEFGEVAVTFSCDDYPAGGAYSGSYTFTAELPEGYVLAADAAPLAVPVILGEGMILADGTTWDGSTVATAFAGGSGTSASPYQIATCGQLAYLAKLLRGENNDYVSKYYILTEDLNLNNKQFEGISYFSGNFDGNGHTISGLYMRGVEEMALFGVVRSSGRIANLTVRGKVEWTGSGFTVDHAGIAATGEGTIENCVNYCTVTGSQAVGGIAGAWSGTIKNCENYGAITGVLATGGIVGRFGTTYDKGSMSVQGCLNYGSVSGKTETGGVVGELLDSHPKATQITSICATVKQCANLGAVSGTKQVGGVIGHANGGGIEQCANVGNVTAGGVSADNYNPNYVGGIVGYMMLIYTTAGVAEYSSGYLRDCYNAGTIIADYGIGGISGMAMGSSYKYLDVKRVYNAGKLYSRENSTSTTYEPGRIDSDSSGNLYYMEGRNSSVKVETNATALTEPQMHTLSNFSGFSTTYWTNGNSTYPYPVIKALGVLPVAGCPHQYVNYVSNNNATCHSYGTKTAQCALGCGKSNTTTDYNSKLPHSYGPWEKVDDSNHKHTCGITGCGYMETASHEWNGGTVTKEPTLQETGILTYQCTQCTATRTEDIDRLDAGAATVTTATGVVSIYDTLEAAITAASASSGSTLTLQQDITNITASYEITSGSFTFDLNGHTLSGKAPRVDSSSTKTYGIVNITGGTVVFTDSASGGKVEFIGNYGSGLYIEGDAAVTVNGGSYCSNGTESYAIAQWGYSSSLTITGSAGIQAQGSNAQGVLAYSGTTQISGGTLEASSYAVRVSNNTTISGTAQINNSVYLYGWKTALTISGGSVNGGIWVASSSSTLTITGGTIQGGKYGIYEPAPSSNNNQNTYHISGGTITATNGPAIRLTCDHSALNLSGGTLSGTTAGVSIESDSTVNLVGSPTISASDGPSFHFNNENTLTVTGVLASNPKACYSVRLGTADGSGVFGMVDSDSNADASNFKSYVDGFRVTMEDNALELTNRPLPAATIDYANERLENLTPGAKYTVNGEEVTAGTDGTISIASGWLGKDITIIQKAETTDGEDSDPQTLTVPGRPAAPTGVQAVDESAAGKNDGQLTGVSPEMEYRKTGADIWTPVTGTSVTGLAPGEYEVRTRAQMTSFAGAVIQLKIASGAVPVSGITVTPKTLTMKPGETQSLTATVLPAEATNYTLNWFSRNTAVAQVNNSGVVTAVADGVAEIGVSVLGANDMTAYCQVIVSTPVEGISLSQTEVRLPRAGGTGHTLTVTFQPANPTDRSITWSSSNTDVVVVSQTGKLTPRGMGTAVVTATASNGVSATCNVTVYYSYGILVNGIEVTNENTEDVLGNQDTGATVTFDTEKRQLHLNNAQITCTGTYGAIVGDSRSVDIVLEEGSSNTVTCTKVYGIQSNSGIRISGNGKLKVAGSSDALSSDKINIVGCTVEATGNIGSVNGGGEVVITNAAVKVNGTLMTGTLSLYENVHLVARGSRKAVVLGNPLRDSTDFLWRSGQEDPFTAGGNPDLTKAYFELVSSSHLGYTDDENGTTHSYGCADSDCINAFSAVKEAHSWVYTAANDVLTESCICCTASGTAQLCTPADLTYTGGAIEAVLEKTGSLAGKSLSVTYTPGDKLVQGLPVNAGTYTAAVSVTGADGKTAAISLEYSIEKLQLGTSDFTVTPPASLVYDGTAKNPNVMPPAGLSSEDITMTVTDENGNPVTQVRDAGTYHVTIDVKESGNTAPVTGLTSPDWSFTIRPAQVTVTINPIGKQLYTGAAVVPQLKLIFAGQEAGAELKEGRDYTVTCTNNRAVGEASVAVEDLPGGNYQITTASSTFAIAYGVRLAGHETIYDGAVAYVDGVSGVLEGDILWLENDSARMVTTHSWHNAGAADVHTVYPTGTFVWELSYSEEGGYTARRMAELDDSVKYAGTSIRITGNQGIRFITSVPEARKTALTGNGLSGYRLVEYGTLMGWAKNGTDLIYGVNAKSIAYDRDKGIDSVFSRSNGVVQYTGMLTDLDLEQSTEDLVTRPYMVLERKNAQGQPELVVLYGGSLVRSIGYVAFQNKDIYQPGSKAYAFIWNILSYAYPDLYEAEYGK